MGGNALKQFGMETRRVDRGEYIQLCDELVEALHVEFRVDIPKSLSHKQSFGDIDVVVSKRPQFDVDVVEFIKEKFNPTHIFSNSGVHSFDYKGVQVDIIVMPDCHFESAVSYFSWNDLGNLMGRIAHKFGVKYGHDGLSMVFREGTHQVFSVPLLHGDPTKHDSFFKFLGLDKKEYDDGFETPQDLYEFIVSSPYFNPSMFAYEDLNHTNRTRNRKRVIYAGFLEWIGFEQMKKRVFNEYQWKEDKNLYLYRIRDHFLDGYRNYVQEKLAFFAERELKLLFNGQVVSEVTGLNGRELGNFMASATKVYGTKNNALYHFANDDNRSVEERIKQFHSWKQRNPE